MAKNTQQIHHLVLYQEDFISDNIWHQVCDSLNVNPDEGDAITVYWDVPATIKHGEEG